MDHRLRTREIKVGNVIIGGGHSVKIQSMTNTRTEDVAGTVQQILRLEDNGCEIIRVAIPNMEAAKAVSEIKKRIHIPLVADIHFDYRLALECIEQGVDKIRINPGNIGDDDRVRQVVEKCKERKIPIRIGVNGGSLEKHILEKHKHPTPEALVESAMYHVGILESMGFYDIVISIKSSDVDTAVKAYGMMAEKRDYPLHLGITEAGTLESGTIKSSVGIGIMLYQGLGDTLRVSLTSDVVDEVRVAQKILASVGLFDKKVEIVSCPTCGRTSIDLIRIAQEVENRVKHIKQPVKIAVMGCAVNGPGEAKEADIGLAGGKGVGLIFKKGEIIRKVPESELVDVLIEELEKLLTRGD